MPLVTLQVLDGYERGRTFRDLPTPITIGREEENTIQLNDDRVSRFHLKIQDDAGRYILTDLDSTNGTWVNGHPVQVKVLRPGDHLSIGRSMLLFGAEEEIRALQNARGSDSAHANHEISQHADVLQVSELFPYGPPELPENLRPAHIAQVSDLLGYVHSQLARVAECGRSDGDPDDPEVRLDWEAWQRLLRLQATLAVYIDKLTTPASE